MSLNSALTILEAVRACGTKRKEKEFLLTANANNEVLRDLFVYTYDWMRTYGVIVDDVKDKEPPPGEVRDEIWPRFVELLARLSNRDLTGGAARAAWISFVGGCTSREAFWLTKVINRDLKVGVAEKTVALAWPHALSPFDCQLAETTGFNPAKVVDKKNPDVYNFPLWVEPKLDGLRVLIVVDGGKATVHSRNGKNLPGLQHFADAFATAAPGHYVVDGEIFHKNWNSTVSLTKTYPENLTEEERALLQELTYYVFDHVPLADFRKGFCPTPLRERFKALEGLLATVSAAAPQVRVVSPEVYEVHTLEEIQPLYEKFLSNGLEGAMVKYPKAPYKFGRGKNWSKIKPEDSFDAVITDILPGTGRNEHRLGAFVVQLEDGSVCNVGSGFTDAQREEFWARRGELTGKTIEFEAQKDAQAVAVVRFPRFIRFRDDK